MQVKGLYKTLMCLINVNCYCQKLFIFNIKINSIMELYHSYFLIKVVEKLHQSPSFSEPPGEWQPRQNLMFLVVGCLVVCYGGNCNLVNKPVLLCSLLFITQQLQTPDWIIWMWNLIWKWMYKPIKIIHWKFSHF